MPSSKQVAALLDWLRTEGAEGLQNIYLRLTENAGWGVFNIDASGPFLFRCPASVALTPDQAMADKTIGAALKKCSPALGDEHLVLLLLLHCRRLGAASRWHPYVEALPSDDEAESLLPMFWPEAEQNELLGGTPALRQSRTALDALRAWHTTVVEAQLIARFPLAFPVRSTFLFVHKLP